MPRFALSRRLFLGGALATATAGRLAAGAAPGATPSPAPSAAPPFVYPMRLPGRAPGEGFYLRHAFDVENTDYYPGLWHTGENWFALAGETAGLGVFAAAAGTVVYVGGNYPGLVVIIRHAPDLYSMYGHLDWTVAVAEGNQVKPGDAIGTVILRPDGRPSHLHFEVRTFLEQDAVNGPHPRYGFGCGPNCPPGPGYWPMNAPDRPVDLGWRNPTHVLARRGLGAGVAEGATVVVGAKPSAASTALWSAPEGEPGASHSGALPLVPGTGYQLLDLLAGAEDTRETSALAYRLWYRLALPGRDPAWVRAAVPSSFETGSDGRPSSVAFVFLPVV